MGKKLQIGRQLKARLFLAVCFLSLLAASLVRGEFVLAAAGAIGLAWALESYRWYSLVEGPSKSATVTPPKGFVFEISGRRILRLLSQQELHKRSEGQGR